jgi:hypothetical protein
MTNYTHVCSYLIANKLWRFPTSHTGGCGLNVISIVRLLDVSVRGNDGYDK